MTIPTEISEGAMLRADPVSAGPTIFPAPGGGGEAAEREALHRLACEAGRTGAWLLDLETRICTLSPMAAALFGLPPEETHLPEAIWRSRIDPDHLTAAESDVRSAIGKPAGFSTELHIVKSNGVEHWLHVRGEVIADEGGRPLRLHGAVVDLTEQKKVQAELEQLNATLEQKVAERTETLGRTQEALRQSQKLEAMGQLTAGLAHDFNNLLTPIIASLDLLRDRVSEERDQRLVTGALRSAGSARVLVQRLLAFARRQAAAPVRVDVAELVTGLAADLLSRTLGPRIEIVLDLAPDLQPARADANQLEMALLNLAVNARDAMSDGGRLTIALANRQVDGDEGLGLPPGRYVRLSVIDSGPGMDEATCALATKPFFTTKEVGEGTGLGLATVDGIALQLGGAFRLTSRVGEGTTASLWLPAWSGSRREHDADPPAPLRGGVGGHVLLVDDHDLVRISTAEMLTELGYSVTEASTGEEAAALMDGGLNVDFVVTDHLMPGLSGIELAERLRRASAVLPMLLVTGDPEPGPLPPGLDCLVKPFRKAELAAALARLSVETPRLS